MLLTIILAVAVCATITLMMFSAAAFIQDKKMFSSAPKEFRDVIKARDKELFYGARAIGWILMVFSFLMLIGSCVIAIWDGFNIKSQLFMLFCCISGNLCLGSLDTVHLAQHQIRMPIWGYPGMWFLIGDMQYHQSSGFCVQRCLPMLQQN